jgi:hypothetical protein
MILTPKTLPMPFSADCVRGCNTCQDCIAGGNTGELVALISQYQFRSFEVGTRRCEPLPSLTNRAGNGPDSRGH